MTTTILISITGLVIFIFLIAIIATIASPSKTQSTEHKYEKRAFLSKNELNFYKALIQTTAAKDYLILIKVNLADIIHPIKGSKNRQASLNKIDKKHIDFVLCSKTNLQPVLAIELDDSSHDRQDRKDRDEFVDQALESAGLKILHIRNANQLESEINKKLSTQKPSKK